MSKNQKTRKNKSRPGLDKKQVIQKSTRRNLKSALDSIYNIVNLDTKMSCQCVCCKTSCPTLYYSEFLQIISEIWRTWTEEEKTNLICKSVEYFFKNEFEKWGIQTLVKPCMLQDDKGLCKSYSNRQLNCRIFGLWPKEEYEQRVEKFAKAYEKFGLKKEDLPLYFQCPSVERLDNSQELTLEVINDMYKKLENLDKRVGTFSDLQISQKHNYRSFHDWVMYKVFGEEWLSKLTTYMMAATKEQLEDQIEAMKAEIKKSFNNLDVNISAGLKDIKNDV